MAIWATGDTGDGEATVGVVDHGLFTSRALNPKPVLFNSYIYIYAYNVSYVYIYNYIYNYIHAYTLMVGIYQI